MIRKFFGAKESDEPGAQATSELRRPVQTPVRPVERAIVHIDPSKNSSAPAAAEERTPRIRSWQDNEITNEENLHINWTVAKLLSIDREMEAFSTKGIKNHALVQSSGGTLALLVTRPLLEESIAMDVLLNNLEKRPNARIEKHLVSNTVLNTVLERLAKKGGDQNAAVTAVDSHTLQEFKEVVKKAVAVDASDIHFRGDTKRPRIDFRILGEVQNSGFSYSYDRLKKLANAAYGTQSEKGSNSGSVLTFETQQRAAFPLDLEIDGKTQSFKLRFELTSCQSGFHAAMRILWMSGVKAQKGDSLESDLLARGYLPDQARNMALVGYKNGGSIVLAGQTGSGKTQTLYCMMRHIAVPEKIAIAVEDPVEGDLEGVTQIQVASEEGKSVDHAIKQIIKSILRLDPDIALISELRGEESAGGFQQLLQSGHKSLTTVHADSPIGIYERLASDQFKLDRGFLSTPDNLSICVFQNLVQRVCPHCAQTHVEAGISPDYMRMLERTTGCSDLSRIRFRNRNGCSECAAVSPLPGIAGREVAASVLLPDDDLLLLLREKKVLEAFRELRSRRNKLWEPDTLGKSAMEVATFKMLQGNVDPREVETIFESYELYESKQKRFS